MGTLISLNGQVEEGLLHFLTANYTFKQVLGVDGGTQHLLKWGIRPHLVLGDMDSFEGSLEELVEKRVQLLITYRDKDYTDGERALQLAKYRPIVFIGLTGLETDHILGNLALLRKAYSLALPAVGYGLRETVVYGHSFLLHLPPGTTVSVIPLSNTVLTEIGFQWELREVLWHEADVPPISNVTVAEWQLVRGTKPFYLIVKSYWNPFSDLGA
ncbi:thiamine diphosphokinase [Coprothermobacteraceae bacterium]|nr:thiamine diphosphokinase [Coprothermobacteraceae bacterium]